ncbi:B3/4 domain-containing protein [Lacticaseibacillus kribbianus]|uniref:B3/B4 domain-containing protein n=1 Tax=Lacticaseibacillus kribbianus TaxID=2926292 RepID=UPI001CD4D918|nr:phenylalanine--tRNA ligase beta subunit-related protein [Lacticaseibacillus kribbianus]
MQVNLSSEVAAAGLAPLAFTFTGTNAEDSTALWQSAIAPLIAACPYQAPADVAKDPAIAAMRAVYKSLGKDPSRYRPSQEALWRRIAQGKGLYQVNRAVDLNNYLSLAFRVSCGLYDRAALVGPVTLTVGAPGESYQGIGKGALALDHLIVAADDAGPFGSPTSDSRRSLVTPATTDFLLIAYAPRGQVDPSAFTAALTRLAGQALGSRDVAALAVER